MRKSTNILGLTLAMACSSGWAEDYNGRETPPLAAEGSVTNDANNTGINDRDNNDAAVTAQTQSNDSGDIELLSTIRQEIVEEDTLSTSAHNIKIVTNNGAVTLRGPVNSSVEKSKVEILVQQISGVESVDNQLEVAANQ
jgi:hyperosmotically inducible periplasmic protein